MANQINELTVSIVLPCRNEEAALADCLRQVQSVLATEQIAGEIIVSDSSSDRSPAIAESFGVKLVKHNQPGYGRAYLEGLAVASGRYIFMADADGSYDFAELPNFLAELQAGAELVIGNRFTGRMTDGAMPFLHRYLGNPLLSFLFRRLFNSPIRDVHCGLRAIEREALDKLNLRTTGMEFASEMVVAAGRVGLRIKQLPIAYHPRRGRSKLRTWPDGWRHLRFMLMQAPDYLFFGPGGLFLLAGLSAWLWWPTHASYGAFLLLLGYQIILFGTFIKVYMKSAGLLRSDKLTDWLARRISFETGLAAGAVFLLLALTLKWPVLFEGVKNFLVWPADSVIILGLTAAIIGVQTMFAAFLISILLVDKQ